MLRKTDRILVTTLTKLRSLALLLKDPNKEAVRALAVRPGSQGFDHLQIDSLNYFLIFLALNRTGRVNEASAGFQGFNRSAQYPFLLRGETREIRGRESPSDFRIRSQCSRPGTRRIDEHAVKALARKRQLFSRVEDQGRDAL